MAETVVVKVERSKAIELEAEFKNLGFDFREVAHARFSVRGEGVVCTVYMSGKGVIQGPGAAQFVERYFGVREEIDPATKSMLEFPERTVGSDETGKGDYFGPLVVAAVAFQPQDMGFFDEVALKDSKLMTRPAIAKAAKEIKRLLPYEVVSIGPAKYNELYEKFGNLNRLLAWAHATALEAVLQKCDATTVIVDKFCDERVLKKELKEKGRAAKLHMVTKGERYPAVAAASILASDAFHWALERLGTEIGLKLPKGAGSPVDAAARRLVGFHGKDVLAKVAKLHFKTTDKVLGPT